MTEEQLERLRMAAITDADPADTCMDGHPRTPENTYYSTDRRYRLCRICLHRWYLTYKERG